MCAGLLCLTTQAAAQPASPVSAAGNPAARPLNLTDERSYLLHGALRAGDGLVELRTRFGRDNVTSAELDGAEGGTTRGIVLFAKDPQRRAELFMQDEKLRGIASLRISGTSSRWHLGNGIKPGQTLAQLAAMNGKPVSFNGLDLDYGGTVTDWHGGKLAPSKGAAVFVSVGLTHAEEASGYPQGKDSYRSEDRRYPKQGSLLFVGQLLLSFPHPDRQPSSIERAIGRKGAARISLRIATPAARLAPQPPAPQTSNNPTPATARTRSACTPSQTASR